MKNLTLVIFTAIIASLLTYFITRNYYTKQLKMLPAMSELTSSWNKIPANSLASFVRDSINSPQFKWVSGRVLKSSLQALIDSSQGRMLSIMIGTTDTVEKNGTCMIVESENHSVNVLMMQDTTTCCRIVAPCCPPKDIYIKRARTETVTALLK